MSETDRTIVVGVDYSNHSIVAMDEALRSAAMAPGTCLVPVLVLPGGPIRGRLEEGPEMTNEVIERSRENLVNLVNSRARALGVQPPRVAPRVRFGAPAEQLLAEARESSAVLIAVGTHGRSGLSHLLLGSVAEEVSRHAPCSVLVARSPEPGASAAGDTSSAPGAVPEPDEAVPEPLVDDEKTLVREPHIDAGRVVLHVLDAPTGQVFACAFDDLTTVSVDPIEGGWVPAPASEARARVGRVALRTAAREHATFEQLFAEIARRKAVAQHSR